MKKYEKKILVTNCDKRGHVSLNRFVEYWLWSQIMIGKKDKRKTTKIAMYKFYYVILFQFFTIMCFSNFSQKIIFLDGGRFLVKQSGYRLVV